jgi:ABC-type glycerol-3-phosphate transport system permease component
VAAQHRLPAGPRADGRAAAPPALAPTLEHFKNVFVVKQFHWYILNSLIVAGATTLLCLTIGLLAAFALARFDVKARFGILGLILSISMFPQIAIVAPLYLIMSSIGLLDTYAGLVAVYLALGLPLVIWVLFGYLHAIPKELDEAAKIDGAGPLRTLFLVILPLALPGIVTTGLLAFIAAWNEFMFALAFTSTIAHQTIPVGIANFQSLYYLPWGDVAAASVVVTLPLVVMVLVFQRRIIAGLTQGAVKE